MDVAVGVLLPTGVELSAPTAARRLLDLAAAAEGAGLDSVWVDDSLLSPRMEALSVLSAVAVTTRRVGLGTATLMPVLRRPVQAAQALATVDRLSEGRLTVGVGAGFPGRFGRPLHALSEVPWPGRFARLDETVALWRQLWSARGPRAFHGDLLRFDELPPGTPPHRPEGPPVWLGGSAEGALVRAATRYDGWLPYPPDPDRYAAGLARIRDAAEGAGRPRDGVAPGLPATVVIDDDPARAHRALDARTRRVYGMPAEQAGAVQAMVAGPAEHVAARLTGFVRAGARHLVCRLGALDLAGQRDQLDRLAAPRACGARSGSRAPSAARARRR